MSCHEFIALEKQLDEVLAVYREAVSAMRTGVTRQHMEQDTAAKEARCRYAHNALARHKQMCKKCPQF
jgi:hypothetical protein